MRCENQLKSIKLQPGGEPWDPKGTATSQEAHKARHPKEKAGREQKTGTRPEATALKGGENTHKGERYRKRGVLTAQKAERKYPKEGEQEKQAQGASRQSRHPREKRTRSSSPAGRTTKSRLPKESKPHSGQKGHTMGERPPIQRQAPAKHGQGRPPESPEARAKTASSSERAGPAGPGAPTRGPRRRGPHLASAQVTPPSPPLRAPGQRLRPAPADSDETPHSNWHRSRRPVRRRRESQHHRHRAGQPSGGSDAQPQRQPPTHGGGRPAIRPRATRGRHAGQPRRKGRPESQPRRSPGAPAAVWRRSQGGTQRPRAHRGARREKLNRMAGHGAGEKTLRYQGGWG